MNPFPPLHGEVSLHMDAPPEKVWDLVSDVTRIGEFSPETFEARWTRGSTGPEVGASFKGHVKRKYVEGGRLNQPDRTREQAWPHPVIANGKLYLRDQDVLLCYDVKAK